VLKTQGSWKSCVAHMKVVQNKNGSINLEYCPTHNSHSIQVAHLPIPMKVKETIAVKLQERVEIEILYEIWFQVEEEVEDKLFNAKIIYIEYSASPQH